MRRVLLFILIFNIFSNAKSQQIREFTADSTIFIDEIKKFTANYISADESGILENFIFLWQSGGFSWEEMTEITLNTTRLVKKNGRASPHFIKYLEIINILYEPNFKEVGRDDWQKALSNMLADKNTGLKTFDEFLKSSIILLKDDELFNLPGNIWKGNNPSYRFQYKDDNIRVLFEPFNLTCYSKRDSMTIFNTSGTFDMINNSWHGGQGLVTWERAGLSRDEVYVNLNSFAVDLRKSEYKADSVLFTYKKYLDTPVQGRFEDKVMLIPDPQRATYPKFFSFQNKYILPDLFKSIEYIGGLSMQGARLIGTGSSIEPAVLNVFDNGELRLHIESQQFLFAARSVNSPGAKITLYLETDSLFHPDLQFSYNESTDEIRFTKSKTYTSASPYTNTYHKMDMNFEEFYWKRSERIVRFRPLTGTSIGIASFESHSFFNGKFFEELQGMDRINPLVALWQYGRMVNLENFPLPNYARYLALDPSQVRQQLMRLSRLGFVYYDDVTDMIALRPKLFYFLDSSVGKIDYDVILFNSRTQAPQENALLNLDNFDLTINGIQQIALSDSQNVVLLPRANKIILKRDNSFQFDGVVHAGLFSFYGSNYFFDYENFKINLQKIDSIGLAVNTDKTDNYGRVLAERINNLLENATGEIVIDDPLNKSGLKSYPQYPSFESTENSYVYFDEKNIQNGVYSRKDVFFRANPFKMDSLDNFTREGLNLKGQFFSGEILPPIDQTLSLMPDNSLGFIHQLPDQGIPVYAGKGTFYQEIELSNKGIRGSGKLEYLTSETSSDEFIFHPDSLMTKSRDFTIDKKYSEVEFPEVSSKNNPIKWLTRQDKFKATEQDVPFTIFSDTVKMHGELLLQPTGLSGNGTIDMVSASLSSENIVLKSAKISSDTADFRLKSPSSNKLAFSTDNVNAQIDFENREGEFIPNAGYAHVEFPENRFISKLDYFLWLMEEEQLHMGLDKPVETSPGEDGLSGPRYVSIHPKQDSMSFVSPMAVYEYNHFIIKATEVPYIQIADARIYPIDGLIVVESGAKIRQLQEAKIIADYTNAYHSLYDASVSINGKNDYSASARYKYTDYTGKDQVIKFTSIRVDTSKQTIGTAELTMLDSFSLSPHFEFQGKAELAARSRLLSFDGATRLIHDCNAGKSWLKFKANIDPDHVMIPVSDAPLDINLNRIYAGIMLTRDSAHVYTTFSSPKKDYFDNYLATSNGYLTYDIQNSSYEIASLAKLSDSTSTGNYLKMGSYSCQTYSEGKIDYLVNFGQLKMDAFGTAVHDMKQELFTSDVMLAFDFFFSKDALSVFSSNLDSLPELKAYDLTDPVYRLALNELVGKRQADIMFNELSLYGNYREVPPEFRKSMILSNVKLKYNMNTRSFRYNGDVGIVRIGDRQINKQARVFIELSKRASGDLLDIYFELNDRTWYYFGYNPGSFQVTSSNSVFNTLVLNLKDNQRKLSVRPGETEYIYSLSPERRAQLFLRRYMDEEDIE